MRGPLPALGLAVLWVAGATTGSCKRPSQQLFLNPKGLDAVSLEDAGEALNLVQKGAESLHGSAAGRGGAGAALQLGDWSVAAAAADAWMHKAAHSALEAARRGARKGAELAHTLGEEALKELLLTKHRSTLSAWRTIDPLGHGRLSFYDFCRAATTLGCLCDTRKLWEALDIHQDGFVSLDEVDPDLAELLRGFAMAVSQTVGSAASAWRAYFSSAGRLGRCPFPRFARISRSLGYAGDVDAVYDALNVDRTPSGVSFKEFAMLDKWFRRPTHGRWDYEGLRPLNAEGLRPVSSVSTPDLHLPSV